MKPSLNYTCPGVAYTRRDFLRVGSLGFLGSVSVTTSG